MIETGAPATEVAALPNEDRLAFPASWQRFVRPRRGLKARRIKLDPAAGREFLDHHAERVRKRLALEANREYGDAGLAFLDGTADVLGAAAVMALAKPAVGSVPVNSRPLFDLVQAEHGLPFAVAALAEALTLEAAQVAPENGVGIARAALSSKHWSKLQAHKEINEVRSLLAAASDADYAAVVAALAERRTSPAHRLTASLLAPDEQAWTDEACAEHRAHKPSEVCTRLLAEVVTTGEQLHAIDIGRLDFTWVYTAGIADLLHRLGGAAFPVIERHFSFYCYANEKKTLFRALAAMPSDEALTALLDRLDEPIAVGYAMEAAVRFPRRTLRLIAARLDKADADERKLLSALVYSDPILLEAALPSLDEHVQDAIAVLVKEVPLLPEAPLEALPPLLVSPPWAAETPKREPVILKGLTSPEADRLAWVEGERDEWAEAEHYRQRHFKDRKWEKEAQAFDRLRGYEQATFLAFAPEPVAAGLLADWEPTGEYYAAADLKRILARFGETAIAPVTAATGSETALREVLLPVASLQAARIAADALARLKTLRDFAFAWLDRHAADAAALLLPDALGRTKKPRAAAETALRYIASGHGADLVREAAARYGDEAVAAVADLVDVDPFEPVGVPLPNPGLWASPAGLPQVLLAGREHGLPHTAVRHLVTILGLGSPEYDYPGVAVVAETCDRLSLARFSLALFEQWLAAGAPSEDGWALTQLTHFGDDEAVRVLAPLIARWPGENQHHRAVKGLKVLGAIGSEASLRAINQIAEKARFDAIKAEAWEQMEAVAANLGLTTEQLGDRLVPDFGLREESALVLDYGSRQFRVGFDEALKPFVHDIDGKPRKTLPKPGAKDDPLLAEASYKRFAGLRKDLRTVASDQVKRLERAMVHGRTWTFAEFEEHFVCHPLVWHLARRLVWTADPGDGPVAFRLAEDKGCTDVNENELHLPEDAVVRLAHPAILGEQVDAWAEIFADYEILQPFEQLARSVMAFTEDERRTGRLKRFEGVTVPVGKLLGLTSKGWSRAQPQDAGIEPGMTLWLKDVGSIVLDLDPGIWIGAIDQCPDQTLRTVVVSSQTLYGWSIPEPERDFGPVDPVAASEALTALAKATGVA
jgi:hypothetical protein